VELNHFQNLEDYDLQETFSISPFEHSKSGIELLYINAIDGIISITKYRKKGVLKFCCEKF